jgi:hypothetical protein
MVCICGREQVSHLWLAKPVAKTLEVYRLEAGRWIARRAIRRSIVVSGSAE